MLEVIGIVLLFAILVIVGPFVSILLFAVAVWIMTAALFAIMASLVGFSFGKAFAVGLAMMALLGLIVGGRASKPPVDRTKSDDHAP